MDTRNKRASAIHVSLPFRSLLPSPGTQTAGDRYQTGFMYRGLVPGDGVAPPDDEVGAGPDFIILRSRRRARR